MSNWDVSKPIDKTTIGDVPGEIRDVTSMAKIVIAKEHATPATSNAGGQHLKGSARVYLDSVAPTTDPEGNALDTSATSDDGRLAILTGSNNLLRVFIATSAGISTSFERVTVQGLAANTDVNMGSRVIGSLAAATESGQAVHLGQFASTDFSISASTGLISVNDRAGAFTSVDTLGSALTVDTVYKAQVDGFINAIGTNGTIKASAATSAPSTVVGGYNDCVPYLVSKDEYIKWESASPSTMFFKPIGSGGLVAQ